MQNITINLIEQNVLYEILIESIDNLNFKINSYNNIIDLNNNLDKTKANVIIADIKNYEIFLKKKINTPILYLDSSPKKNKEFLLNSIKCPFKLKNFI